METETYKGHSIEIKQDINSESPREWDNVCVFHIAHKRYDFGDKNYNTPESIQEAEQEAIREGDIVLPLYIYDHSGITISLTPFACRWDSGRVGFVQVSRSTMIAEHNKKIFTSKLKARALLIAQDEVKILDCYLCNEVVGYVVDTDGDSCWGYYSVEEALAGAKEVIDYIVSEKIKNHFEQVKMCIRHKVPYYARTSLDKCMAVL